MKNLLIGFVTATILLGSCTPIAQNDGYAEFKYREELRQKQELEYYRSFYYNKMMNPYGYYYRNDDGGSYFMTFEEPPRQNIFIYEHRPKCDIKRIKLRHSTRIDSSGQKPATLIDRSYPKKVRR